MSSEPDQTPERLSEVSQTVRLAQIANTPFDDYTLIGKLGHGGMAEVFLALEEGVGGFRKLIVIKRLHHHLAEEPEMVEMFLDEARLAARLNHPHVVQTNKIGTFEGQHFIAMEYLEGQPLSKIIKRLARRNQTLPPELAARCISDALDGLAYAHAAKDFDGSPLGIIHRDISPQNIFVTYDGAVKLLDFGIAKATTQEALTRTGLVKGKFAYIAPEQADGRKVDARADLWSMGVVFWESLTGRRLFKADNELATLNETLTKPIPLASDLEPGVPVELAHAAEGALQRATERRYASALDFRDHLEEWLASQSSHGGARSILSRFLKDLFADTIDEQRELIRDCVAQVEANRISMLAAAEASASSELDATGVARRTDPTGPLSMPPPPPVEPESDGYRRAFLMLGILLLIVLLAVLAALVLPLAAGPRRPRWPRRRSSRKSPSRSPRPRRAPSRRRRRPKRRRPRSKTRLPSRPPNRRFARAAPSGRRSRPPKRPWQRPASSDSAPSRRGRRWSAAGSSRWTRSRGPRCSSTGGASAPRRS